MKFIVETFFFVSPPRSFVCAFCFENTFFRIAAAAVADVVAVGWVTRALYSNWNSIVCENFMRAFEMSKHIYVFIDRYTSSLLETHAHTRMRMNERWISIIKHRVSRRMMALKSYLKICLKCNTNEPTSTWKISQHIYRHVLHTRINRAKSLLVKRWACYSVSIVIQSMNLL